MPTRAQCRATAAACLGIALIAGCSGDRPPTTVAETAAGDSKGAAVVGIEGASGAEGGTSTGASGTLEKK